MRREKLVRAAMGVSRVKTEVPKTPAPNKIFPPNLTQTRMKYKHPLLLYNVSTHEQHITCTKKEIKFINFALKSYC